MDFILYIYGPIKLLLKQWLRVLLFIYILLDMDQFKTTATGLSITIFFFTCGSMKLIIKQ